MNDLQQIFNYQNQEVRTVIQDGQPWFVAKDVAGILGYANTKDAISSHVDEEDKTIIQRSEMTTFEIPNRGLTVINESGLYSLILSSKMPDAKKFKRWVTSEILPTIRQTGQYGEPKVLTEREGQIQSLELLLDNLKRSAEMEQQINKHEKKILELNTKVDEQITLDHGEQRRIQKAVASRVYSFTEDGSERKRLFSELHREIKDRFAVSSYKDLKRKDMQVAVNYIVNWVPRRVS
ncbi:ORF6C domain-containing protein [Bacillus safensis]|uniref:BRO family protein n=1 Tax=Bacillus TaxID=1386 RepID=UPI00207601FF|nr:MULTISPECIES: BRO family protein [Bacillus]MDI6562384.1 BRO family protein [Bacillus altitudinis]USD79700.1 ORF6C domain-containing protein [Bacillus safensis]